MFCYGLDYFGYVLLREVRFGGGWLWGGNNPIRTNFFSFFLFCYLAPISSKDGSEFAPIFPENCCSYCKFNTE